jgi:hypothetical protein
MKLKIGLKHWIMVLPFILFWFLSLFLYYFGIYEYKGISPYGLIYVLFSLLNFIIFYNFALHLKLKKTFSNIDINKVTKIASYMGASTLIGVFLFVLDKARLGSELIFILQTELYNAREFLEGKLTYLTTIGVLFYSFKSVFFITIFFLAKQNIKISKVTKGMLVIVLILDLVNMYFSANRGMLYSYFAYFIFYLVYVRNYKFKSFFKINKISIAFILFCLMSGSYFFYVANNRTIDTTLEYQAENSQLELKYDFIAEHLTLQQLGSFEGLYNYFTHGLEYTDTIVLNTNTVFNFDIVSALGIRFKSQIKKIYPSYKSGSTQVVDNILLNANKSIYGWPSVFGFSIVFFGLVGGIIFFCLIGFLAGCVQKKSDISGSYIWIIMSFSIYECMLLSYDWFIRDFNFLFSLLFCFYLATNYEKYSN